MKPSSRTPEGNSNRCSICGNDLRLDPSRPPGDAPCPFCGCLLWFDTSYDPDSIEDTPGRIRLEFHGGCKDGMVLDDNPRSLAEDKGYRYYRLAKNSQVGKRFREVPVHEYGKTLLALKQQGRPVSDLSPTDIEQITRRLQHVSVHVYEVTEITETADMIEVRLQFTEEVKGL